jgi:VCBS repeat-containing protein
MKEPDKKKRSVGTEARIKDTSKLVQLAKDSPAKTILLGLATGIFFKQVFAPSNSPVVEDAVKSATPSKPSQVRQPEVAEAAAPNLLVPSGDADNLKSIFSRDGQINVLPDATVRDATASDSILRDTSASPAVATRLSATLQEQPSVALNGASDETGDLGGTGEGAQVSVPLADWVDPTPRPLTTFVADTPWTDSAIGLLSTLLGGGGIASQYPAGVAGADGLATILSNSPVSGFVVDGYIKSVEVSRWSADRTVQYGDTVVADASGYFQDLIGGAADTVIVVKATAQSYDIGKGVYVTNASTLCAPGDATVVTPITTLIQYLRQSGLSDAAAKQKVIDGLGLPTDFDYLQFDQVAAYDKAITSGDAAALEKALSVQKAASQIFTFVTCVTSSASASKADYENISLQVMSDLATAFKDYQTNPKYDATSTLLTNGDALVAAFENKAYVTADARVMLGTDATLNQLIDRAQTISDVFTIQSVIEVTINMNPLKAAAINSAAGLALSASGFTEISTPDATGVTESNAHEVLTDSGDIQSDPNAQLDWRLDASTASSIYGNFSVTANGHWTFESAADNEAVNKLAAGQTVHLVAKFNNFSGSEFTSVDLSVQGVNDAPVVNDIDKTVSKHGQKTFSAEFSDVDTTDSHSISINTSGLLGAVTNNNGEFSYDTNGQFETLGGGQTATDTFTYTVDDGHGGVVTKTVTITVTGTNVPAVIGEHNPVALTETNAVLTTSGTLTSTDADGTDNVFTAETVTGTYGSLTMGSNGAWTYTAASAQDQLTTGTTATDTFTVHAADGTAGTITVTITGTNDAAVISGTKTFNLTETNAVLATSGTLTSTDVDGTANAFIAETVSGTYGSLTMGANGAWTYTAASAQNQLADGVTATDAFTVHAADNTESTITVNITGTNDAAVISGTKSFNLTETNAVLTTSGTLTSTDVDGTANSFRAETLTGTYGSLTMGTNGAWTYTAASAQDQLVAGASATDTFTVHAADGTVSTITVNITGTNDAAVISGTKTFTLTETNAVLTTSGTLTATDVDGTANAFAAETLTGTYGSLTMGTNGAWTYTAASAQDQLVAGASAADTFTVHAADGTASTIAVTITGTNDAAVISGTSSFTLTETNAVLTTSGTLTSTDVDGTVNAFTAETVTGSYGNLVMRANGSWNYTAKSAQDELGAGASATDTFTVHAADGTVSTITVNITGTNDAAVISGTKTFNLTETDAVLTTSGTLTSTDVDGTANAFTAETVSGAYGSLTMGANGAWNYTASSAQDQLVEGAKAADVFTVHAADGTASTITVTITGTNDLASIDGQSSGAITEANAILSTGGTLTVSDLDTGQALLIARTNVAGSNAYGHFSVGANGVWTYTMDSAHDEFSAGQTYTDSITVSSADGTDTQVITVTITGTNDTPRITNTLQSGAIYTTIKQGTPVPSSSTYTDESGHKALYLAEVSGFDIDNASQIHYEFGTHAARDAEYHTQFAIDSTHGYITLTKEGAEAIAAETDANKTDYYLHVRAVDQYGAYVEQEVDVHVERAIAASGLSAALPGTIGEWDIAPITTKDTDGNTVSDGFLLISHVDPLITIHLPASVTTLSFDAGSVLSLSNDALNAIGQITDISASTSSNRAISISSDTTENTIIDVQPNGNYTIVGASDSVFDKDLGQVDNYRSDVVNVKLQSNVAPLASFLVVGDNVQMVLRDNTSGNVTSTTLLRDIEAVQFSYNNGTETVVLKSILMVAGGGYATLTDAQSNVNFDATNTYLFNPSSVHGNDVYHY